MGLVYKEIVKHLVTIITDGHEYIVEPYALQAKVNDIIYFQNLTKSDITLLFPEKALFDTNVIGKIHPGESDSVTIKNVEPDSYPYIVYVHGYDDFASKPAAPKIIIYDDVE